MKRLGKRGHFSRYFLVFTLVFCLSFASAAVTQDDLHLNIQVTDALGKVQPGSYNFQFDITTDQACTNTVYTKSENLATDSRGIISYYLTGTNLQYGEQYYLCYYRDGQLIETMQIARSPYAFRAKYVNVSGIQVDQNLDLGNYNLTANYLFGDGSLLTGIDSAQINMSDYYNVTEITEALVPYFGAHKAVDLNTQNLTAGYFIGDGRYLTNINVNSIDLSNYYTIAQVYNKSEIDTFNSGFVPYVGATGNVDLGANNITSQYFFGSGRYLTDLNVDEMNLSEYYKKTEVYNRGETFNQTEITTFLGALVPYIGALTNLNMGSNNVSASYFIGDGSQLTNLNINALDLSNYYTKAQVYNKTESDSTTAGLVPYTGATGNVNLGSQNITAQYYLGSGRYLTDLDINSLDLSEYYKKVDVYNKTEIDSAGFVTYTGASQNVDLGSQNISAAYFIGDGSQLTNLNVNLSEVNYWSKNGNDLYYNDGNVGIGTDSPLVDLDVVNLVDATAAEIRSRDISGRVLSLISPSNGQPGRLKVGGTVEGLGIGTRDFTDQIFISGSNGRVGIGETNPDSNLHVYDAINSVALKVEADGADDDSEILVDRAVNTQRANLKFTTGDSLDWNIGTMYNAGNGNEAFSISTSNNLENSVFVATKAGAVGIGDTTPDAGLKLDVEGNLGAQMLCDENGQNCVDVSTIEGSVTNNPVVGFFSDILVFSVTYAGGGVHPMTLFATSDFCGTGDYLGVIKEDGTRQLITTPFGGTCTTTSLVSDDTEVTKYLVWNHADSQFNFRYTAASMTADEQIVGIYDGGINKFQWLVDTSSFRFTQTNNLNMGGNNIALSGGYLSGDGGDEGIAVDSTGRVGIGTPGPSAQLHVNGDVIIDL